MKIIRTPLSGCGISLRRDICPMASSTNDQYSLFPSTTSPSADNAISSPESAAGRTPSTSPAGPASAKSGPPACHVSRFRSQDSDRAMSTNDTSGPLFTVSSPSAALQRSLENRLRLRMGGNGSPLFALTWRAMDMPSGPPACQLAASARPTGDTVFSGWPTARAADAEKNVRTLEGSLKEIERKGSPQDLAQAAAATWPTPATRDGKGGYLGGRIRNGLISTDTLDVAAQLASWPTPLEDDANNGTRASGEYQSLTRTALGTTSSGSPAATENGAQLNPAFSRWLLGFPAAWDACAPTATQSLRRSRRNSSKPTLKEKPNEQLSAKR